MKRTQTNHKQIKIAFWLRLCCKWLFFSSKHTKWTLCTSYLERSWGTIFFNSVCSKWHE